MADVTRATTGSEATFDAALDAYQCFKAVESNLGRGSTIEEEERLRPAFEAALAETDAAFARMIIVPVVDGRRVWSKFAAILDHYHVGGFGLDPAAQAQVFAEARTALTGEVA